MKNKWMIPLLFVLLLISFFLGGNLPAEEILPEDTSSMEKEEIYSTREEVAGYLHAYKELPPNFITKKEALARGWVASQGNLWEIAPGKSIGGDSFGNREGLLPEKAGRKWYECDIDYQGGKRGAKRIVFSNDGLIYYTEDHYKSFTEIHFE